jgi:hypothetical protein
MYGDKWERLPDRVATLVLQDGTLHDLCIQADGWNCQPDPRGP